MYICVCKAITEKQLEEAKKKSKNLREIYKNLGLGSECGTCIDDALEVLNKSKSQYNQDTPKK